ncbi:hypothetical protein LEP1GSC165_2585 [Leptospira santarosai str. CBC523]|nr:hypothetical protein LEP1GSC165_2585 [Leptospira santarosai str. CBC523]
MNLQKLVSTTFILVSIVGIQDCSFFKTGASHDCRKNDSCPMIFTHQYETPYHIIEQNQKLKPIAEGDSLRQNTKLLVITDTDGKPQAVVDDSGANYIKCIHENKEIYVLDRNIVFGKKIRVYSKPNVVLLEKPELNSKVVGNLEFNSSVTLVSELELDSVPNGYIRVTSDHKTGWAQRKNFTDGDYNAEFNKKSLEEILQNFDFTWWGSAPGVITNFEIKWKGIDAKSLTCQYDGEKECSGHLEFNSDGISILLSLPNDANDEVRCWAKTVDLLESIETRENNTAAPAVQCNRTGDTD